MTEARVALGVMWPIVEAVALAGQDVKAWAVAQKKPMEEKVARGYLRAALDVLVAHQEWKADAARREHGKHRPVGVERG